jgi:hypothetical protein
MKILLNKNAKKKKKKKKNILNERLRIIKKTRTIYLKILPSLSES